MIDGDTGGDDSVTLCEMFTATGQVIKMFNSHILTDKSMKTFKPVLTIPDGQWTCAVNQPSTVSSLSGVGGFSDTAECALQCTGHADCRGINTRIDARLCEIYSYIPSAFALVSGCEYRQVRLITIEGACPVFCFWV